MAIPTHMRLEVVTPDRHVVRDDIDEIEIPGSEGYFGVLPGHTPMLAALSVGEMWYRKGDEKEYLSIAFGFAEVLPDRVTVLAQLAERAAEIDRERAEEEKRRAEARLTEHRAGADYEMARASLMKALTRLQVSNRSDMGGRVRRTPRLPDVK